jgi:uroporphyrinogen-III synthase
MTNALAGARVVNTRALHQASDLDALLRNVGAIPLSYPCLAIVPPADTDQLDSSLRQTLDGQFEWLVLTSTNAVNTVADRLAVFGKHVPDRSTFKIAAVGDATATAIASCLRTSADFVSVDQHGKALARELPIEPGSRALMPVSDIAHPEPAAILRARGAAVTSVVAYRTVTGSGGVDLPDFLRRGAVDAITFTSPSAVTGCLSRLATEQGTPEDLSTITIVTIGPTTYLAAKSHGLTNTVMSPSPSLSDLVVTLEATLAGRPFEGGEAWLSRSSA